jgi:hypothetical protein
VTYSIHPIRTEDLWSVAEFIERHVGITDAPGATVGTGVAGRHAHLQNRLVENPAWVDGVPLGHLVRAEGEDQVVGTSLIYPWRFLWGDRRLLGFGGGGFYVEPAARMQGFLLFRRMVALKTADFWFATTCNEVSAALWARSKAAPIPGSDLDFNLVLQAGPIAREVALRRGLGGAPAMLAGWAGGLISPLVRPRRTGVAVRVTPSQDWDKLSALAERHRDRDRITCDRSADYMRWTYERAVVDPPPRTYEFSAGPGREGWFAIGFSTRGKLGQIRGASLLDWSIPADIDRRIPFAAALDTILDAGNVDLFSVSGRVDLPAELGNLGFRRRSLAAPTCYVLARETTSGELAPRTIIADSDRF